MVAQSLPPGQPVTLMLRPHRIRLEPAAADGEGSLRGRIVGMTYLGDLIQYEVDLAGTRVRAEQASGGAGAPRFAGGDEVRVGWAPGDGIVFDQE
jgi:putative spermidine/putrescine transport system ATP-binding protein